MSSPVQQRTARQILVDQLRAWGLSELTNDLDRLIKEGLDGPAITLQLSETAAYKERFKANEIRRKKGLPVLSPAEYIAAETSYQMVMRTHGLPTSFYDDREDFHNFLGNDVSPDELNERASVAQQVWLSSDDETKSVWRNFYGLSDGAAIASILDPDRALPVVQRMANAARFGARAESQGLNADRGRLERYADEGYSEQAVAEAFGRIGLNQRADQNIAARFGQSLTQADSEAAEIEGSAAAIRKRNQLRQSETALFRSGAAAESGALSRTQAGKF